MLTAREGDNLTVPVGVTHASRNPTDQVVTVYNTHEPALRMKEYFEEVSRVLDKVTDRKTKPFRMNPKTMLYMGVLMNRFRPEIIAVNPPDPAVRVLGWVGKAFGLTY